MKHKYYHSHEERKEKEKMSQHETIVPLLQPLFSFITV